MPPSSPSSSYESHFEHSALFEFSTVINASLDLRFILGHILLTLMGKLLSTRALVALAHDEGRYRVEMTKGLPAGLEGNELMIKTLPSTVAHVGRMSEKRHPWTSYFAEHELSILIPLMASKRPIGILAFSARQGDRGLKKQEETYLRSLASISATAIEKCHMIEELGLVNRKLDRKIQELNTLFEVGKEFGAVLDPEKLVRLLVFSLLGQVGVNRYLICLKEGSDMRIAASRIDGATPQPELLAGLTRIHAGVHIEDMIVTGAIDPRPVLLALRLKVAVPMELQGQTRGVLLLGEKLNREPFTPADFEFLSALSSLAIIALENARLFQQAIEKQKMEDELAIAREIQKGLLPSILPALPGFELAAANFSSKQVGGDYYDAIPLDDHRLILAIGDVSGKGTPASLLMANIQATIRALVPLDLPLTDLTARVNNLMCPNTGGSRFVTFFWGCLDHARRVFTYVNAGHNHPYLLHADGSVDRLDKGGMILGVMETTMPYEEGSAELTEGDVLVLFTDGVSEAMNAASEEYGEERLEAVIRKAAGWGAQGLIDIIHQDIIAHAHGAPQSDDITMMVMRVVPT
ncbi:MAG: SpoIIE family protein phosphatase [Ignavibacteriae bacterium]|nr:SpoIIE family protein phosphatase [Ignavibacteriota bacterium]